MIKLLAILLLLTIEVSANQDCAYRLNCSPEQLCSDMERKVSTLPKECKTAISLIRNMPLENSIAAFKYSTDSEGVVIIDVEKKPLVGDVTFEITEGFEDISLANVAELQRGDFFDYEKSEQLKTKVQKFLEDRGTSNIDIRTIYSFDNGYMNIHSIIHIGDVKKITSVSYNKEISEEKDYINRLYRLKRRPYSKYSLTKLENYISTDLNERGYYRNQINLEIKETEREVVIHLNIIKGPRELFDFRNNKIIARSIFLNLIRDRYKNDKDNIKEEEIKKLVKNVYEKRGFYNSSIIVTKRKQIEDDEDTRWFIDILEGRKISIENVSFRGNLKIEFSEINKFFNRNRTELVKSGFYDKQFFNKFSDLLKKYYLKRGYIFAEVSEPKIQINNNKAEIEYSIKEKQQCVLSEINLINISSDLQEKIKSMILNKELQPLDVVSLEDDVVKIVDIIRGEGFLYASIDNINSDDLIVYSNNYSIAKLNIKVQLGRRVRLENVIISGNKVTKSIVLERELKYANGELVTPNLLKDIRDKINGLGLFSNVVITPYVLNNYSNDKESKVNLLVQVTEKEFRTGEIAPGFRTDIGAKISLNLNYNNFLGMNHLLGFKFQLNNRFSLGDLDERRKRENDRMLEGLARLNYSYPYFLNFMDLNTSLGFQRKRFYSFDADILQISPSLSKSFLNNIINIGTKYQLESIRQYDATEIKDRNSFRIGSITPSLSVDLRDDPIDTRSGAFFGFSWEFANPLFLSQQQSELDVNFSKLVNRNKFYIPMMDKTLVFAFSLSTGVQKNFANEPRLDANNMYQFNEDGSLKTKGYIPSIKVFRLDGVDNVRGFADSEINRLETGEDINEVRVQGKAFFTSFKFEPRYYVNDSLVLGMFFDAGRLFIDHYKATDLRSSVGLSLKVLTPVGTLDFDYGIKTKRNHLNNGGKEGFGRFHLSIGHF